MNENENNESVKNNGNGEEAAAPANPFAAFSTSASEQLQQPAESSAASTRPYYVAPAQPQPQSQPQPAQPYGYGAPASQTPYGYGAPAQAAAAQAAATQQPYYGTYGTAQQPPVPPATPTPPVQNIYPGYEPPATGQKRRWPWFILGLFVGIVIGMGGCAGCVGCMALADYDNSNDWMYSDHSFGGYDNDYDYTYPYEDDDSDIYGWTPEEPYGDNEYDGSSVGVYTYDELVSVLSSMGLEPGTPGEGNQCSKGIYSVGSDGQIPAGLYYLEGSNEKLSHFYVFDKDDAVHGSVARYEADVSVLYFGNYYAELEEGDLIAFDPGTDVMMHPASPTSTNPTPPYNNGCYRVGIDIPAGSYTITAYAVDEGETDEDSAAYIMKDLDFGDDSIVDTQYVIAGGQQTITVEDGQYLELFAATATPANQA